MQDPASPIVEPMFQPNVEQPIDVVTPAGYQGKPVSKGNAVPRRELTLQEYVQP
jgi:hypothetical protein